MTSVPPNDDDRRNLDSGASKVMDAAEHIRAYLANQWKPIRLNSDTKRPVDDRWPERWVSEEDLIAWHRVGPYSLRRPGHPRGTTAGPPLFARHAKGRERGGGPGVPFGRAVRGDQ